MPAQGRGGRLLTPPRFPTPLRWFWLAAVLAAVVDLLSKVIVFASFGGGPPPDNIYSEADMLWVLPGAFRLICHYNTGGAFGWGSGRIFLFLAATAVLLPSLVLLAYHTKEPGAPLWSLGIVVGGAVGNLYDRLFHIGVRDFLEIVNPRTGEPLWPVFNIADVAIVAGVAAYLIWSVADSVAKRRRGRAAAGEE